MKKLIIFMIVLISGSIQAAIYVNQNSSGGVEYTDTPNDASQKINVPPTNSISTPAPVAQPTAPATATTATAADDEDEGTNTAASSASTYTKFEMISPQNEATFQNQPAIPVEMVIEPNMLPGDKIQLMLDGKPAGTPTATSYQELGIVERGTHTLYAVIVNNKNQPIKQTSTITIFVHRTSTITSPAANR